MSDPGGQLVTQLLHDAGEGDPKAASAILPLVYNELRRLASAQMLREAPGQTLQGTALVHEAYVRLIGEREVEWNGRAHFYGAAARAMRRILVERARRRSRLKHGGGLDRVALDESETPGEDGQPDLISLDAAIDRLESLDKRKAEVVHLRYFAGLTIEQVALALGLSQTTVKDDWMFARAWLKRAVRDSEACGNKGGR